MVFHPPAKLRWGLDWDEDDERVEHGMTFFQPTTLPFSNRIFVGRGLENVAQNNKYYFSLRVGVCLFDCGKEGKGGVEGKIQQQTERAAGSCDSFIISAQVTCCDF